MKIKYFLTFLLSLGFYQFVNAQAKNQSINFVREYFKNKEPVVYTDNFFYQGMINEFREVFSHDTLKNNNFEPMLILSKEEKTYIRQEIEKMDQKFGNKKLLKKSRFIPREKLDSMFKDPRDGLRYNEILGKRGYYSFSKPIFIRDNSICIFYSQFTCGSLCAQGDISLYKKEGNKWVKWVALYESVS